MRTKTLKASQRIRSGQRVYENFMRTKGRKSPAYENLVCTIYSGFTVLSLTVICCGVMKSVAVMEAPGLIPFKRWNATNWRLATGWDAFYRKRGRTQMVKKTVKLNDLLNISDNKLTTRAAQCRQSNTSCHAYLMCEVNLNDLVPSHWPGVCYCHCHCDVITRLDGGWCLGKKMK